MNWKEWFEKIPSETKTPKFKKILGIVLIVIGVLALITPFTPGAWLIFVGFGILGIRLSFWEKMKDKWNNRKNGR